MKNTAIPVLLLTGYLGSGKTTLLNRILTNERGIKFAVIVNDIGEVNIDADLIAKGGVVNAGDDSLVPLQNGCICCTLKSDLARQICDLADSGKFDYIVIEASGICEPEPIAQTICALPQMGTEFQAGEKVFLVVLDNFRYDQWRVLASELSDSFDIDEQLYCSILPTATQYARNALFSGLMPNDIERMFPDLWVDEDADEGKNVNEEPLIRTQIERFRRHDTFSYYKINDNASAERYLQRYSQLSNNDINVVVFNFIDMLSHARTESKMVRELANTESAYRSITLSWFRHSAISELFQLLARSDYRVIVTTDHGSVRSCKPVKIIGDRNTNTNLRYKLGKNLAYDNKDLFVIKEPHKAHLPSPNVSTSYVFATGDSFFAYPNNYNYYVSYYKNTFQHGGISLEEMVIPLVTLKIRD